MKRRTIKKWIKRYISPHIKHLPDWTSIDYDKYETVKIINGEFLREGMTYKIQSNPMKSVQQQERGILEFLDQYKDRKIQVRSKPIPIIGVPYINDAMKNTRKKFFGIRTRFFIEKQASK